MGISLEKVAEKAPALVSLAKEAGVSLRKSGIGNTRAKVALVLDYSGSMSGEYRSGAMQRFAEKILALGTQLDDDGAIDFFVFDAHANYLGEITLDDYQGSVNRLIGKRHMGTTNYAEAFYAVANHFNLAYPDSKAPVSTPTVVQEAKKGFFGFGKKDAVVTEAADVAPLAPLNHAVNEPVFAMFLTDGGPDSKPKAIKALVDVSYTPIFWKFFSIGNSDMSFLEKLDNEVPNRFIDNANHEHITNIDTISDADLFTKLIEEYPIWLQKARQLGLIK